MQYRAFISYSHTDEAWATWLHRALERYRVPKRIVESRGLATARLAPIFRDREELGSAASLSAKIREALAASEALIVLCSPAAASSEWVNREIEEFEQLHGGENIFCCIVEGRAPEVFPPTLRRSDEPLAADLTAEGDGRRSGFIKLVAGLLGVGFDDLRRREYQVRSRRLAIVAAASLAGMTVMTALGISALIASHEAEEARAIADHRREQAEDLLAFMVGDLRESLQPLGRLNLLDPVGDQAMAYFESVDPDAITDRSLKLRSRVLTQIGEIRMWQFQYAPAVEAFEEAYNSAESLTRRHPEDGDMLFQRSQAEFWTGEMSWRNGDLDGAEQWFRRYRESSLVLHDLDPSRDDWLMEVAYGHHNLGVLAVEQRRMADARRYFEDELAVLQALTDRSPSGTGLHENFADANSWLGTVAEREGALGEAVARYDESTRYREALLAESPDHQSYRLWFVVSQAFGASARAITGRVDEAYAIYGRLRPMVDEMVEQDPGNRQLQRFAARLEVDAAELLATQGARPGRAEALAAVDQAIRTVKALLEDEPEDRRARITLTKAYRVQAKLYLLDDRAAAAASSASRSIELVPSDPGDVQLVQELGAALVIAAVARERGAAPLAASKPEQPRRVFEREAAGSRDPRTLDALARIAQLEGDPDRAAAIIGRLEASGYVPIWPWSGTSG